MEIHFKILRFDPQKDDKPYFQDFVNHPGEMDSVLEALMDIRDNQDPSLSFRYSCREAVCGSCGMVINGNISLACKTTVKSLKSRDVIIEPLPNLIIQKDLVVDMEPFYKAMESIEPYLQPNEPPPEKGFRIQEKRMDKIFQFVTCIWCGCCYTACPVVARDPQYTGPAALAKLYRFVTDPRDARNPSFWTRINTPSGVWGCDTVFRCNDVCPKNVRPADGIIGLRQKLVVHKAKGLLRKKT